MYRLILLACWPSEDRVILRMALRRNVGPSPPVLRLAWALSRGAAQALRSPGGWQRADCSSDSPLCLGKIVLRLEVHPELGFGAEPVPETERGIAGDGSLARYNLANSVRGYGYLASERCWSYPQLVEFLSQYLSGMDCALEHFSRFLPSSDSQRSQRRLVLQCQSM